MFFLFFVFFFLSLAVAVKQQRLDGVISRFFFTLRGVPPVEPLSRGGGGAASTASRHLTTSTRRAPSITPSTRRKTKDAGGTETMPTSSSSPGCVSMRSLKAVARARSSKAYRKFTKPGKAAAALTKNAGAPSSRAAVNAAPATSARIATQSSSCTSGSSAKAPARSARPSGSSSCSALGVAGSSFWSSSSSSSCAFRRLMAWNSSKLTSPISFGCPLFVIGARRRRRRDAAPKLGVSRLPRSELAWWR